MSKFNDLWQLYINEAQIHTEYKSDCFNFIKNFVIKLVTNLDWQSENVGFYVFTEKHQVVNYREGLSDLSKNLVPASKGYWYFGLRLQLWKSDTIGVANLYPVNFVVPIFVGKFSPYYCVKIGNGNNLKEFRVTAGNDFQEISDYIHQKIKDKVNTWIHWDMETQNHDKFFYL